MRIFALFMFALLTFGCEQSMDPASAEGAMNRLRDGVVSKDTRAILDASSSKTHELLAQVHALLVEQRRIISERYPKDAAAGARAAYPAGVLEAEDTLALFGALVKAELEDLKSGPGLKHGMSTRGASAGTETRRTVPTHSGESVEFVLEDGLWKVTAFEHNIEATLRNVKLNQQTIEANLKVFSELERREKEAKAKAAEAAKALEKAAKP